MKKITHGIPCVGNVRKMLRIMKLAALLLLVFSMNTFASSTNQESITIKGKVTDASGLPLPGVSIIVKGEIKGTTTNVDGNYSLDINGNEVLIFSFVGMLTQEVNVTGKSVLNVQMKDDAIGLGEVVAVGYGTQKKANLTGSVATVDMDEIKSRPITSSSQALSGMVSGVSVTQESGRPGGDGATIRIRGTGTLGNSNPLVIVDGIPGSLNNVNPSDIASFSVLKDAASCAIYGSRAANGVVLITTKQGKKGKMQVDYEFYTGVQQATKKPDLVTNSVEFMNLYNTAVLNEDPTATPTFTQAVIDEYSNGTDPYIYPNTNWMDELYRKAKLTKHNLRISGGNENTTYAFSAGYVDQKGIIIGTDSKQTTLRFNLDSKMSDKFNWALRLSGRHDDVNQPRSGASTVIGWGMRALPMHVPYLEDGRYGNTYLNIFNKGYSHPIAGATEGKNNSVWDNLLGNVSAEYEIIKDLKVKGTVGLKMYHTLNSTFSPYVQTYDPKTFVASSTIIGGIARSATEKYITNKTLTYLATISYNKTFSEDHNTLFMLGYNQEEGKYHELSAYKDEFPNNELSELNAGASNPTAGGYTTEVGLRSYFGRFTYDYQGRYLLESNFRYDGSSRFSKDNRWGFFPSVSVGWRVSEESFLNEVDFLDNLKIRASWGKLGNQEIDLYEYIPIINLGEQYSFNGSLVGGGAQKKMANPDIVWETSTQTNIGVDLTLWGGKLGMELDYFNKITDDILRPIAISSMVGDLDAPTVNLAKVQNTGWELMLRHSNNIGDFSYEVGVNVSQIHNEVIDLPVPQIDKWSILEEGRSMYEFYAIKMAGIFQNQSEVDQHKAQPNAKPGDIKFEDYNNDGKIDSDDRQVVGRSIPEFTYGMNFSAAYKGFDFSLLFQGVENVNAITEEEMKPFFNGAGIPKYWAENAWTPENQSKDVPRLTRSSTYVNNIWRDSSFLLEDASFLRLKNIQLGYTLSSSLVKRIGLGNVRVYVNAQNPLTFTDYRGLDPEKKPFNNRGTYSNVKTYTAGINISF